MKQKYRVMVLCSLMNKETIDAHLYEQFDDTLLEEIFRDGNDVSPESVMQAAIGCSTAASTLDCDFAVINPPEVYRQKLEQALVDRGIIPVYPTVGISYDGGVYQLGYRNSDYLPEPHSTPRMADRYRRWLESSFYLVPETDLAYCNDPWRTFVRFVTKGIFKGRVH